MDIDLSDFDVTYCIADNRLWLSLNGQAHLPIDPNELVDGYEKRIAELEAENHYLNWFHATADFGPADYDVVVAMQAEYEKQTGKPVPDGWRYRDENDE